MCSENCFKDFTRYTTLNVLGMIGISCYILADTFFISKGLGTNGLASLNLAIPIYSFIHGCGLMIGIGGGSRYSFQKIQQKNNAANHVFTTSVLLAFCFSLLFFLTGLFFSGNLATYLGANTSTYGMSKVYIQVILLFAPMFITNNLLICFVRNDGAPNLAMMAMLMGSFSNIILDYILIFPLNMGMLGAALATGIAPIISLLILSSYFLNKKNGFHLIKQNFSLTTSVQILTSGLPSLVTEISSGIVIIVFNIIILKLTGNTGVAAYGIIANISLVVLAIYTGIAQGVQPLISSSYGAGQKANIKALLRYAIITVIILSAIVYLFIFIGSAQIVAVFNSESNEALQNIAITGMKYYFTGILFAGCNIVTSIYFTSTNNVIPAQIISILRGFVIIIPMAYLLSTLRGINGIWLAFPVTEIIVSIVTVLLWKSSNHLWHRIRIKNATEDKNTLHHN
ncbi:MAG: MATE family efflux transporter [Suipraeoptans sp.]